LAGVSVELRDNIAILTLNRLEKLNALNRVMWSELKSKLSGYCGSNVLGIILTGSGRAFSSGDDISEMYSLRDLSDALEFFGLIESTIEELALCQKPVVAAVNGLAVGGGAEILFFTDYVIASKDSWFSFPEARIGLIAPILLTVGVSTIGLRFAKKLSLTCERLIASDALRLGLVDEVVDSENLLEVAVERVKILAQNTTRESLIYMKKLLYQQYRRLLSEALNTLIILALSESSKDRMRLFLEKKL